MHSVSQIFDHALYAELTVNLPAQGMRTYKTLHIVCNILQWVCGVHSDWLQDAIKKTSKDELPDFYNIQLERPKDDDKGYDVLFIDAASKVSARALPYLRCSASCTSALL